ncbi:hypothetical protein AA14337_3035 [Acetobacter malorum DSM 14337]|uniref:Uncharacterized protein n=1 Tax=Acetobacter malorum DSM 14337 TaxID=1307910 RepID=A0ABQ0PZ83_9PROT|nr:hypothetical protein [Acetobacter malorum]KXV05627.1 hypothetical protein AD930_10830 [Acetobacter malorum]GBQ85294.1 hypothetical protein AA14337_3035 [Acetobacter malorum DSM 14337]
MNSICKKVLTEYDKISAVQLAAALLIPSIMVTYVIAARDSDKRLQGYNSLADAILGQSEGLPPDHEFQTSLPSGVEVRISKGSDSAKILFPKVTRNQCDEVVAIQDRIAQNANVRSLHYPTTWSIVVHSGGLRQGNVREKECLNDFNTADISFSEKPQK